MHNKKHTIKRAVLTTTANLSHGIGEATLTKFTGNKS